MIPLCSQDWELLVSTKGQQTLSIKSPTTNILGFVGHMVLVKKIHFCHCSTKAAIDKTQHRWMWLCSSKTLLTIQCSGGGPRELHFKQACPWLGCRWVLLTQCRYAGIVVQDHSEQCRKFSIHGPYPSNASRVPQLLWQLLVISKYPLERQYHL